MRVSVCVCVCVCHALAGAGLVDLPRGRSGELGQLVAVRIPGGPFFAFLGFPIPSIITLPSSCGGVSLKQLFDFFKF